MKRKERGRDKERKKEIYIYIYIYIYIEYKVCYYLIYCFVFFISLFLNDNLIGQFN